MPVSNDGNRASLAVSGYRGAVDYVIWIPLRLGPGVTLENRFCGGDQESGTDRN